MFKATCRYFPLGISPREHFAQSTLSTCSNTHFVLRLQNRNLKLLRIFWSVKRKDEGETGGAVTLSVQRN
jgi:hypothetical protein